jgi:hypothetical protein
MYNIFRQTSFRETVMRGFSAGACNPIFPPIPLHNHIKLLVFLRTSARFVYEHHNNHNYKISSIIVAATAPLRRPLPLFHPLVPFHKTVVTNDGEKNIQPPKGVDGHDKCFKKSFSDWSYEASFC